MRELDISADDLIAKLLSLAEHETVCILDSCDVEHLGSHLLIAGIGPIDVYEGSNDVTAATLRVLNEKLSGSRASIFTLSYGFGEKLHSIPRADTQSCEPDLFVASFDCLIVHDYRTGKTFLTGSDERFDTVREALCRTPLAPLAKSSPMLSAVSNFSRDEYIEAVAKIQERIRAGDTYQANLTQQIRIQLGGRGPAAIFSSLRTEHPAPFASFVVRGDSTIVSASPERFFKISNGVITASPIKGTRPRGKTSEEDERFRNELASSEKDRAENTMIVDLTRNDLGRICEYGSVRVERLCELEEHPTLFHLVSTVTGTLRNGLQYSDIVRALFPCGSITGAPKLSTMKIIAELEPLPRGLSMGSIGVNIPPGFPGLEPSFEMNVAIRTIVVRNGEAVFNVGGGIVIDSDPSSEHDESLLKAQALLAASGAKLPGNK